MRPDYPPWGLIRHEVPVVVLRGGKRTTLEFEVVP